MDSLFPDVIHTDTQASPRHVQVPRFDGWANVFTGLGGVNDKTRYTGYGDTTIIDDDTLALIYSGDGLGGRIVDIVADDMTREWVYLGEDEDERAKEVMDELTSLAAEEKFNEAIKWQRLFGGVS